MARDKELYGIEMTPQSEAGPGSHLSYSETTPDQDNRGRYGSIQNVDIDAPGMSHGAGLRPDESTISLVHPPHPSPKRSRRRFSWWQSIGILGVLTLILGTLIILASCGLLIFLWKGTEAALNRNELDFWKTIVSRGWAPQVVTIGFAAIRTSIALQIGLLMAALAAIMLETSGVRFGDIPLLSTQRAAKSGPLSIVLAVMGRTTSGLSGYLHSFIIILALIIILILPFVSTILLSDFAMTRIAAPAMTTHPSITYSNNSQFSSRGENGASYWKSKPSAQWRFAESQLDEAKYGDTGNTYRAMLPWANEEARASLELYKGPAVVTNPRTMCTAPSSDSFSIEQTSRNTIFVVLQGSTSSKPNTTCRLVSRTVIDDHRELYEGKTVWPITICSRPEDIENSGGPYADLVDPKNGERYVFQKILVLNASRLVDDYHKDDPAMVKNLTFTSDDVWTKATDRQGEHVLSVSVCYFNEYLPQIYDVTMSGRAIPSEPILGTDDTMYVRIQFGIGEYAEPFEERGILKLDIGAHNDKTPSMPLDPRLSEVFTQYASGDAQKGWAMSNVVPYASVLSSWGAHNAHTSVFQRIIQETRDPALAIQTLGTRLYQMVYYDWLNAYDLNLPVESVNATETLLPARWKGLTLVLSLVAVHFGLAIITMTLFFARTRASALGNAWQTVAQIVHTTNIPQGADTMLDSEVEKWAKATGQNKEVYAVSESAAGDKFEIQLRYRKGQS